MSENYFRRALEINVKNFGQSSLPASEGLPKTADGYEAQGVYDKAKPYLLRAVKAREISAGPEADMTGIAVWALCNFYDRWGKPEKSQPCWHRATGILEKLEGMNSPMLKDSLAFEASALRKLGRTDDALKLEKRVVDIQKTAAQ